MYVLASNLAALPIISLQTGRACGVAKAIIVDPANLEVIALACNVPNGSCKQPVLMVQDIRELALDCLIINSEDEIVEADDVVRLARIMDASFKLGSQDVITDMGRRLGRVEDYTISSSTYIVQKLYVRQSLIHSLLGSNLIIDHSQIIDVNNQNIIVRDTTTKAPAIKSQPAQIQNS